jgi:hypothetical protein
MGTVVLGEGKKHSKPRKTSGGWEREREREAP